MTENLPKYDDYKTDTPPEAEEIELGLAFLPEAVLRRALRDELRSEPRPVNVAPMRVAQSMRDLVEMVLRYGYGVQHVVLRPEEAEERQAGLDQDAADRKLHEEH